MKVSVVIPTYNNEGTIAATVESALAQRFEAKFEVIVVNDGSTDSTRGILAKFGDRIRVIDQKNSGVSAARNAGIRAASGEYIALLDGDDTWNEDKLQKTAPVLDENPACAAVFSDVMQVDGAGKEYGTWVSPEFQHSPTLDEMLEWPWPNLPSATVIRRETIMAIGGFSEEFGRRGYGGEDTFAALLVRERGEIHFVPDKLVRYRLSDFNGNLAKRIRSRDSNQSGIDQFEEPERLSDGLLIFARLVREHFGARGRKLAEWAIDKLANELIAVGMTAMHEGDRTLARRCYRASLRYRPLMLKTYFRLGWAMLPAKVAGMLSPMLPPRLRRSLSGPPFHGLPDRPQ
ncbi:MAG: glycosyltransferase family A protein [Candidatus Binatus sp.]|jgi:glycosyltransferase involved in cell wall biosynthesis|uniref:glycosyltransferase family 2 protein n=1 Tax=Candidatus Binatus sp. TaxID=2811406 RepID=UPI003D1361C7